MNKLSFLCFLELRYTDRNESCWKCEAKERSQYELTQFLYLKERHCDSLNPKFGVFSFISAHVPSTNMEEVGFMNYTAASHQEAIKML